MFNNRAPALKSERRTHAVLAIFEISLLVSLLILLPCAPFPFHSQLLLIFFRLSSPGPALYLFFWHALFRGSFLGFVLRYYLPRLSRFLAPRNTGCPLRGPIFCARFVDRSYRLREGLSRRFRVTRQ